MSGRFREPTSQLYSGVLIFDLASWMKITPLYYFFPTARRGTGMSPRIYTTIITTNGIVPAFTLL